MIIKKLVIKNFRSYYGEKVFEFSDRLNMILGSNGDGKSTFFDAMNWVLTYKDETVEQQNLPAMVSAKYFAELETGKKGEVSVALTVENGDGRKRLLVRSFIVKKGNNGEIVIESPKHEAFLLGTGNKKTQVRDLRYVFEDENVLPAVSKRYCIFQGEEQLKVFDDNKVLSDLIDLYSDIKDMDPYKKFLSYTVGQYQGVVQKFKDSKTSKSKKQAKIQNEIDSIQRLLEAKQGELATAQQTYEDLSGRLEALQDDIEILDKVKKMQHQIAEQNQTINSLQGKLWYNENYTLQLLDKKWILMGIEPILEEFQQKMDTLREQKKQMEHEYTLEQLKEISKEEVKEEIRTEVIEEVKQELLEKPLSKSEEDLLRMAMNTHRCSICGTEAPEGSAAYEFMMHRLQESLDRLAAIKAAQAQKRAEEARLEEEKKRPKPVVKELFIDDNIDRLCRLRTEGPNIGIAVIPASIQSQMEYVQKVHDDLDRTSAKVEALEEQITNALAQSVSGADLSQSLNDNTYAQIKHWYGEKESAKVELEELKTLIIPDLEEKLEQKKKEYKKLMDAVKGSECLDIIDFMVAFYKAVGDTERETYQEFLDGLAGKANKYLDELNVDDFTGVIRIKRVGSGENQKVIPSLEDNNGKKILKPNTSLATTMNISLLFAIADMTKETKRNEYPLIFDAPTSSFDQGKDLSFYLCLSKSVDKQCIVVTKSYLYKDEETGQYELDRTAFSKLDCKAYRIRKLTGFDKKDITTIDTQIEPIKL